MTYRVRNIVIAVGLAALAACSTSSTSPTTRRRVQKDESNVTRLRRARDIPIGHVRLGRRRPQVEPVEIAPPQPRPGRDLRSRPDRGLVAAQPVFAGEQVSTRRFRPLEEQGIQRRAEGQPARVADRRATQHQLLVGNAQARRPRRRRRQLGRSPRARQIHVSRVVLRDLLVLRARRRGQVAEQDRRAAPTGRSRLHARRDRQPGAEAVLRDEERRLVAPAPPASPTPPTARRASRRSSPSSATASSRVNSASWPVR